MPENIAECIVEVSKEEEGVYLFISRKNNQLSSMYIEYPKIEIPLMVIALQKFLKSGDNI